MKKAWCELILLAVLVPASRAQEAVPRNIILFGWDGAQREHVMQLLEQGKLPTLKQVTSEGQLVNIDIRGVTDTKAGWSQILSGYDPDVTGVFSNSRYQPVPEGLSVFERLEQHFGANAFVTVAVIGKKEHCGDTDPPRKEELTEQQAAELKVRKRTPVGGRIIEENGRQYLVTPGKPYLNMAKVCDQWVKGLVRDKAVGEKAIAFLEQYKDRPFFFFVHFAEVDHSGHARGENSPEYSEALISNDAWTGRIIAKLQDLNLYDRTIVYITADHGFDEGATSHRKAPYVFLGTNDRGVCRSGDRADITPTIYDRFQIAPASFQPPLAGSSLLRLDTRPPTHSRKAERSKEGANLFYG